MRDLTLTDVERLQAQAGEADEPLQMDDETFRAFYDRTARALWIFLSRTRGGLGGSSFSGAHGVDDLLQETYYRFLRTRRSFESDAHRRNYLFRIATNVLRDARRRDRTDAARLADAPVGDRLCDEEKAGGAERRADLDRALTRLKPRDRQLLWLAYAQGSSHREIADVLGLKTASVKLLLFRARRRLATLLRADRVTGHHSGDDR
jgi:RNA polymerase sigma-70 factor (ECF subfamily)